MDFKGFNKACPKDDFLVPYIELLIDATTGYVALSFVDRFSRYNQIKLHQNNVKMTVF